MALIPFEWYFHEDLEEGAFENLAFGFEQRNQVVEDEVVEEIADYLDATNPFYEITVKCLYDTELKKVFFTGVA